MFKQYPISDGKPHRKTKPVTAKAVTGFCSSKHIGLIVKDCALQENLGICCFGAHLTLVGDGLSHGNAHASSEAWFLLPFYPGNRIYRNVPVWAEQVCGDRPKCSAGSTRPEHVFSMGAAHDSVFRT